MVRRISLACNFLDKTCKHKCFNWENHVWWDQLLHNSWHS